MSSDTHQILKKGNIDVTETMRQKSCSQDYFSAEYSDKNEWTLKKDVVIL